MAYEAEMFQPTKTYANEDNLKKAIDKAVPENYRYHVAWTKDGRCYAIFMGMDALGVAHRGFNVIGG